MSDLMLESDETAKRYSALARAFHWVIFALIFAVVPIAWYMTELDKADPTRAGWYGLHKSIGMTILILSMMRLLWRWIAPPPALAGSFSPLEKRLAGATHFLLYAVVFAMAMSGYLMSAAGGHPVALFNLMSIPAIVPVDKALADIGHEVHELSQWALYVLLALHVLAAGQHQFIRRDGVFKRIMPW